MKKEYRDYLIDIINAIDKIEKFIKDFTFENFSEDDKTISAVIRKLEIIGEAVKKIPISVKKENKQIPWKEMAGMRDKLIHEYFGVNIKVVWRTIKEDLPKVKPLFEKLNEEISRQKRFGF